MMLCSVMMTGLRKNCKNGSHLIQCRADPWIQPRLKASDSSVSKLVTGIHKTIGILLNHKVHSGIWLGRMLSNTPVNSTEQGAAPVATMKNPMCSMYVLGRAAKAKRLGIQLRRSAEAWFELSWLKAQGGGTCPASHSSGNGMMWSPV